MNLHKVILKYCETLVANSFAVISFKYYLPLRHFKHINKWSIITQSGLSSWLIRKIFVEKWRRNTW